LLVQLGKACDRVAVECNGEVVELESFSRLTLRPNDRLELVHFVGGG
jgi:thiamine biosynthesis protein ThiS